MPRSLPGLAAAILESHAQWQVVSVAARFERTPLVPAYLVGEDLAIEEQPGRAAQAVLELVQKLDRLKDAYACWPAFDAAPYFDLHPAHAGSLFQVEETSSLVRVRIYADLLLPAFRAAERYWVQRFLPAYHAGANGGSDDAYHRHLVSEAAPQLAALLNAGEQVVQETLELLGDNLEVLACLGGLEERIQHRPRPGARLASELPPALQRLPREMPTLTLDVIYPRPPESLPGREVWLLVNNLLA